MRVSEAFRSLSSVPPLLRTIDNIPETASPAELVDISMGCPAIQSQQIRSEFVELAKMVADRRLTAATLVWQHGMVGWEPAAGVANLKPLLAGPPPLPGGGPPPLPGA